MPEEVEFTVFHSLNDHVCKLLSDIYGLGMEKTAGDHSQLRRKLEQMAKEMDAMVQEHIQNTVKTMTKNAEAQCPHIFPSISDDIEERSREKSHLPGSIVRDHVTKQTGTEIINKVSELNLAVATLISDKVTDTLLGALSQCNSTLTEQLNKQKQERALSREEYKRPSSAPVKQDEIEPKKQDEPEEPPKETEAEEISELSRPKGPSATDNILPAMRKERAASIAKRKQRPISKAALDLDYKDKSEDQATPPRSISPIVEPPPEVVVSVDEAEPKAEKEKDERKEITQEEEPVYSTVNKKRKKEEAEEKEEEIVESGEMVDGKESKKETKKDESEDDSLDMDFSGLPVVSTKKLEHVTKGRARPKRRTGKRPVKADAAPEMDVDDFFTATITNTDFDKVPTPEEEKKEKEKEESEHKKTPKRPPGARGMPMLTPDMLKRKKKVPDGEEENDKETKEPESPTISDEGKTENGAEEGEEKPEATVPSIKKRPPGAMGLPGMGFGGNVLAEMKLKKLNRSKTPEGNGEKTEEPKNDSVHSPFGPSMLKKTNHPTPEKKEEGNSNSNNNNSVPDATKIRATPNRWKSQSFERKEKPELNLNPTAKSPLMPNKPSPPPASNKPSSLKGRPPPLPNKPKPAARTKGLDLGGARARPVSEFIDPSKVPSSVRLRARSWGKKDPEEK